MSCIEQHKLRLNVGRRIAAAVLAAGLILSAAPESTAQDAILSLYTINGGPVSSDARQLMIALNLAPGHYYVDQYGNTGLLGQPPMVNLDGGPPRMSGPRLGHGGTAAPTQPPPTPPPPPVTPFTTGDAR